MINNIIKTVCYGATFVAFLEAKESKASLTFSDILTRISLNNTPPASRKISAPRGVTHFWGIEN